jgi:hypothetical protein
MPTSNRIVRELNRIELDYQLRPAANLKIRFARSPDCR